MKKYSNTVSFCSTESIESTGNISFRSESCSEIICTCINLYAHCHSHHQNNKFVLSFIEETQNPEVWFFFRFIHTRWCNMGVSTVESNTNERCRLFYSSYTPFTEDKPTNTQRILFSLANTFIFMGFVITATVILILLYKFKCYKVQCNIKVRYHHRSYV